MKEIWSWIQLAATVTGGALGWFIGGFDGLIYTLVAFVVCDYVTGVLRAVAEKKLSSRIGAQGIVKKITIFIMVGIANMVDVHLLGGGSALRTAVLFFYISNEGISMLENAGTLIDIPEVLRNALAQLHTKSGSKTTVPSGSDEHEYIVPPHPTPGAGTENESETEEPDNES